MQISGTAGEFKQSIADAAQEVMVVRLARRFIPGGFAGQFNGREQVVFPQRVDGAIDRGKTQRGNKVARVRKDFLGAERAARALHNRPNRVALLCVALHGVGGRY